MTVARLYLIRHGETDWNLSGRVQGHHPTSLNETGRQQAELLADFLAGCPLKAVWSSDLPRAMETAAPIAARHGLTVKTTPALRERDLAPFVGMNGDEIDAALKGAGAGGRDFTSWYEVPGVENDESMLARLLPALAEAGAAEGEAAVVTHGGAQKVLLHRILGIPEGAKRGFIQANGLVIPIVPDGESWKVEGMYNPVLLERLMRKTRR